MVAHQRGETGVLAQFGFARGVNPFSQVASVVKADDICIKHFFGRAVQISLQAVFPVFVGSNGDLEIHVVQGIAGKVYLG